MFPYLLRMFTQRLGDYATRKVSPPGFAEVLTLKRCPTSRERELDLPKRCWKCEPITMGQEYISESGSFQN